MKGDEFKSGGIKSVNKVIIALAYLNQGRELQLGDWTCRIAETNTNGFSLLYLADKEKDEWFGFMGMDLNGFTSMCAKLTDEQIVKMKADMALQEINQNKRRG